jgi:hypothetical protein
MVNLVFHHREHPFPGRDHGAIRRPTLAIQVGQARDDLERLSMQRSTRERISSKVGANCLPQPATTRLALQRLGEDIAIRGGDVSSQSPNVNFPSRNDQSTLSGGMQPRTRMVRWWTLLK